MFVQKVMKKLKNGAYYPLYHTFRKRLSIDKRLIFLESRQGASLESSLYALLRELSGQEYASFRVVVPVKKGREKDFQRKIERSGCHRAKLIPQGSLMYYYYLSRAAYLVTDVTFPGRFIKKEGQRILNVWHGTPLKRMGRDDLQERASLGNMLRNFLMSDYLLYPNQFMEWAMTTSFMLPGLYKGRLMHTGYPRNDVFFSPSAREEIRQELGLSSCQVIAYLPTYRGLSYQVDREDARKREEILKKLDHLLGPDQVVLYKPHPLEGGGFMEESYAHIRSFPGEIDTSTVLCGCDVLVTDYSSVFFDFAMTKRPIVLFPYDKEQYLSGRGLYLKFEELPFPSVETVEELLVAIGQEASYFTPEYEKAYATWENGHGSRDALHALLFGEELCECPSLEGNGKENVLLYAGNLAQNGVTTAFVNLYGALDQEKRNYYVCFRSGSVLEEPGRIERLPEDALVYPLGSEMNLDPVTALAQVIYLKTGFRGLGIGGRLARAYEDEVKKHFPGAPFEAAIHYGGYEDYIISLILALPCKKAIYCHSNMALEIKTRRMVSPPLIRDAYALFDQVICVSQDGERAVRELTGGQARTVVAPNLQDTELVRQRGELPFAFDVGTRASRSEEEIQKLLKEKRPFLICLGRFSREKGQVRLLEGFARFLEELSGQEKGENTNRGENTKRGEAGEGRKEGAESREEEEKGPVLFLVGGGGPDLSLLKKRIQELRLEESVVLIQALSNPMPLLKRCSLLVIPSLYEGCPVAAYEAAALGVPVLSARVPGCEELAGSTGMTLYEGEEGLLEGLKKGLLGEIPPMQVDFEKRQQEALRAFEGFLESEEPAR